MKKIQVSVLFYGITQDPQYIMASNFEEIHKLNILHQDFHPGNILSLRLKIYISQILA